jgi:hypothetical protein
MAPECPSCPASCIGGLPCPPPPACRVGTFGQHVILRSKHTQLDSQYVPCITNLTTPPPRNDNPTRAVVAPAGVESAGGGDDGGVARRGGGDDVVAREEALDATRGRGVRVGGAAHARASDAPRVREQLLLFTAATAISREDFFPVVVVVVLVLVLVLVLRRGAWTVAVVVVVYIVVTMRLTRVVDVFEVRPAAPAVGMRRYGRAGVAHDARQVHLPADAEGRRESGDHGDEQRWGEGQPQASLFGKGAHHVFFFGFFSPSNRTTHAAIRPAANA